jgi:hypothetical protein
MMKKSALTLLFAVLLLVSSRAFADTITLTLSDPTLSGVPGSTLDFIATVSAPSTNTGSVFLNGDSFNVGSPLTLDDSGFSNFPLSLDPGTSATDVLFSVTIPADAAITAYTGSFTILGGSDGGASDVLATTSFQVNAVPEPSNVLLVATGLAGLAFVGFKRVCL